MNYVKNKNMNSPFKWVLGVLKELGESVLVLALLGLNFFLAGLCGRPFSILLENILSSHIVIAGLIELVIYIIFFVLILGGEVLILGYFYLRDNSRIKRYKTRRKENNKLKLKYAELKQKNKELSKKQLNELMLEKMKEEVSKRRVVQIENEKYRIIQEERYKLLKK